MEGMHFPLKKWAVRAIQSHIDTHYIEMMSMNHTTNFNHIMQIALIFWFSVNYGNVKNLKNKMNQAIHYYNQKML